MNIKLGNTFYKDKIYMLLTLQKQTQYNIDSIINDMQISRKKSTTQQNVFVKHNAPQVR